MNKTDVEFHMLNYYCVNNLFTPEEDMVKDLNDNKIFPTQAEFKDLLYNGDIQEKITNGFRFYSITNKGRERRILLLPNDEKKHIKKHFGIRRGNGGQSIFL